MKALFTLSAILLTTLPSFATLNLRPHPRLFVDGYKTFAAFNAEAETNALWKSYRSFLVADADRRLDLPLVEPKKIGMRLLDKSWKVTYTLNSLATAYRLTGDGRYLARAKKELLATCAWPSWNPSHYLDVATLQIGIALAYDWLYDDLTCEERATVRAAIVAKGWDEAEQTTKCWWKKTTSNWQAWCWNGIGLAALAIAEDVPDRAEAYVTELQKLLPISLKELAPNGAYPEGPSYWEAGVGNAVLLAAAIESATDLKCTFVETPGFLVSGSFPRHLHDPQGLAYNFSDAGRGRMGISLSVLWLAGRAGERSWAQSCLEQLERRPWERIARPYNYGYVSFLVYAWSKKLPAESKPLPLDYSGLGPNPVVTMRTAWNDSLAAFVGLKGGSARVNHGHMDVGSFIYSARGVRWAEDLGSQDYHSIEKLGMSLWDMRPTSDRWKIFRISEKGHNLVTIDDLPPVVAGMGTIEKTDFGAERSSATINLDDIYRGQAKTARRTAILDRKTGALTLVDEFTGVRPGATLRWKFFTFAKGTATPEGVQLALDRKRLIVKKTEPAADWQVEDFSKPQNPWDSANRNLTRVSFTCTAPESGDVKMVVELRPAD